MFLNVIIFFYILYGVEDLDGNGKNGFGILKLGIWK